MRVELWKEQKALLWVGAFVSLVTVNLVPAGLQGRVRVACLCILPVLLFGALALQEHRLASGSPLYRPPFRWLAATVICFALVVAVAWDRPVICVSDAYLGAITFGILFNKPRIQLASSAG